MNSAELLNGERVLGYSRPVRVWCSRWKTQRAACGHIMPNSVHTCLITSKSCVQGCLVVLWVHVPLIPLQPSTPAGQDPLSSSSLKSLAKMYAQNREGLGSGEIGSLRLAGPEQTSQPSSCPA
ncbi:Hypothetical predicted protein [Podarcis lilfordi]|uniref:Uncharacterized protein n=1 Tax=Podarcis lilfordi TaxID=74358 RepID=A0AA35PL45_9SAUR|nr:Hypothetical predicted protein [Podarcis lilfordi]